MAERFLIDTSAAIKYLNETLPVNELSLMDKIVDKESIISFIAEIELQGSPPNQDDLKIFQFFVSNSTIIGVDDNTVKETIRIRKFFKLKLPDALIFDTAITNNMILIADNDKDFKQQPELKYINPNVGAV